MDNFDPDKGDFGNSKGLSRHVDNLGYLRKKEDKLNVNL